MALGVQNPPAGFIDMVKLLLKQLLGYLGFGKFNLQVNIKGELFPVRGKVFMQNCLVEIPVPFQVMVGDEVELPVRKILAAKNTKHVYINENALYVKKESYSEEV